MTSSGPGDEPADKTPARRDWNSLAAVLFVQTQNAFNDNLVKFVLIGLALAVAAGTWIGDKIQFVLSALLPIPFIVLAPIAGYLADRYSKRDVIYLCLVTQLFILIFITVSVIVRNVPLAVLGFFLLSVQSALFSPAKMGVLKELVGSARLGMVNGLMQMLAMLGILAGMWLGGSWFDDLLRGYNAASFSGPEPENAWRAALIPIGAVTVAGLIPLIVGRFVQITPAHPETKFQSSIFFRHFVHLRYLFKQPTLRLTALGIAYYWFVAYFLGLTFVTFGKEMYPDLASGGASSAAAKMTVTIGIGLALGSSLVSILSRRHVELGMVPFGGLGLTLGLLGLGVFAPDSRAFTLSLGFIGFSAGFYLVPLSAFLQDQAEEAHRGRVLSANNLLTSLVGVGAISVGLGLEQLGLSASTQVLVFVLPTFLVSLFIIRILPRNVLYFILYTIVRTVYRVKALNVARVPKKGGALLICNHVSYIDSLILSAACPRRIRFIIDERFLKIWWVGWFLRLFNVIPISPNRSREAIQRTVDALGGGDVVCVFPEGQLTRTGLLNELKRGFELIVRESGAPVLPVYIDALWGSIFSYERGNYFFKLPRRFPYGVCVNFGALIPSDEATSERARAALQDLSVDAFAERAPLRETLAAALTRALKRRSWRPALVDHTGTRKNFSRATVLGTAEVIADQWGRSGTFAAGESRVGIVLPHSSPAVILEVAAILCGKVPIVLPLTSAPTEADLGSWGIRTIISSERVRGHLPHFPWPEGFIDIGKTFRELSRGRLLLHWLAARFEPSAVTLLRTQRRAGDVEAEVAGYVSEEPGGRHGLVTLNSRQINANVEQLAGANFFRSTETILSEAPTSTAEGNLFSLWYPLLSGSKLIAVSIAAENNAVFDVLVDEGVSVFLPAPSRWKTIRDYEGTSPEALRVVLSFDRTGIETGTRAAVFENLGATLAAGSAHGGLGVVLSLSMPDPNDLSPMGKKQFGSREGSVGRLLPALAARVVAEGGVEAPESPETSGQLWLRGGCLPEWNDWRDMCQVAHFDHDGFLFLD